jgi:2-C-methyl-D-erythritol 4-phosphate cytidylyltransferase
MMGGKPVIVHTVEKFLTVDEFEKVIVLAPKGWIPQTQDILKKHVPALLDRIAVVAGGAERNDTIMNAVAYIESEYGLADDDIIVTHDAVRPFVTYRIIEENIAAARECGAVDTVIPATDTIVQSVDGAMIADIPPRSEYYQGQTPQSFNALRLKRLFEELPEEQKAILTDACKILVLKGERVALVRGDVSNIKLTYTNDMRIARAMVGDGEVEHA